MEQDIFKGRKKMRRQLRELRQMHESGHTDYSAPGHALAEGFCDAMQEPDETKRKRTFGQEARIPVSGNDQDHEHAARLAARAGDAGSMHVPVQGEDPSTVKQLGEPSSNPLAYALRFAQQQAVSGSLRQSSTERSPFTRLRTARGDRMDPPGADPHATGNVLGGFSHPGEAVLRTLDAAAHAGEYRDPRGGDVLNQVNYSPYRPDSHQIPTGSADNGSHSNGSQQGAACPPRQSMKNSEARELIKKAMFG